MRQPLIHMSTGAWIFASAVAVSIIASTGVHAVSNAIMAIGNPSGTTTAYVTPTRQLQTVMIAPNNVVHIERTIAHGDCATVYTPPAGKGIVVTQITYVVGDGTNGATSAAVLHSASDCLDSIYDYMETVQAHETQSHTFPTGLPMPSVSVVNGNNNASMIVTISGYLIPASQLPPDAPGMSHGG